MNTKPHHCCEQMEKLLDEGKTPITYLDKFREYCFVLGEVQLQTITYCPWCGTKLPTSLRDEWFDQLEALGLEPESPDIPLSLTSGSWWRSPNHPL